MKSFSVASPWELALGAACAAVGAAYFAPAALTPILGPAASVVLFVVVFVWYRQRLLRSAADEYTKLQTAGLAVQVLWLTVLYDIAAGLIGLPAGLMGPISALLLASGAAALAVSMLVALDLALVRRPRQVWLLGGGYAVIVAVSQMGVGGWLSLAMTGLLLGLVAPMAWQITLERRQRVAVLLGGFLATVPLGAGAYIFGMQVDPEVNVLVSFIPGGSLFCVLYAALLLLRGVQAWAGASLYEKKVKELDAVYDFGLTATSALDRQEFQTAVLRSLRRIGAPDVVALVEPEPDEESVNFSLLRVDSDGSEHVYRHKTRASWMDLALRFADRRPLSVVDHARSQPALARIWEPASGSSVVVPVLNPDGEPRALLIAGRHEPHGFPSSEVRSLSGFANQVGLAMEHSRLLVEMVESERRKSELEFARQMQLDLLPKTPPSVEGLDIADRSVPATEVGGDYFDYLGLPNGHLGVVFGDVAGHGMTAGLMMAMAKSAVHTQVRADGTPELLLPRLGETLLEMSAPNQYMTMVFAELDAEQRSLSYVNAGHHFPLLYRAASGEIEHLESTGPPLGLLPVPPGQARDRELSPGDVLAFYSDGLVEAFDKNDQEFGIERLGQIVSARSEQPAATIVEEIFAAVRRFTDGRPWHDDATLVVVRVLDGHG